MATQKKVTKKVLVDMAGSLGLSGVAKLRKEDLIHKIQVAEGNTDCFTRITDCAVNPCLYRSECQA